MTAEFQVAPHEAVAVAVMQQLGGKASSLPLSDAQLKGAQRLASALRRGDKAAAFRLSAEFYPLVLPPAELPRALKRVLSETLEGNPNFQIVIDSLKEQYGQQMPAEGDKMPLDQALVLLLLAITHSDKNAIYYNRFDAATGKMRPTTFPLTEKLVRDFLAPFGDTQEVLRRVLVIQKGVVIGNPAGQIAWLYSRRKKAWEQAQAKAAPVAAPAEDPLTRQRQAVALLSADFDRMIKAGDAEEQAAQRYAFQGDQLRRLIAAVSEPKGDFKDRLEALYAEKLTRQKASLMAMKLSVKLKRMMTQMGTWDRSVWQDFQERMQGLGIWDGSDWLARWNADKSGKQLLARSGKDYLLEEKSATVDDLLAQSDKIKDKQRGRHMLSKAEIPPEWLKSRQPSTTPAQRRALDALARTERLEDLIDLSLPAQVWEALDGEVQARIYRVFALYTHLDMPILKDLLLDGLTGDFLDQTRQTILALELSYNRIVALFDRDPRMTYAQAVEQLFAQQDEEAEKARLNSLEYQRSPAAQYGKYRSG